METTTFGSKSIIPWVYEKELNEKYGIVLGNLRNGRNSGVSKSRLEKNVSFNWGYSPPKKEIEKKIFKKYKKILGNCAMKINDFEEMEAHIKKIYEISYNHYILGKETNIKESFPNFCCGISSCNLALSLMEKGYPNSSFFYNSKKDHAYVGLPFIFKKEKGFILVDPTSDQLFKNKKISPRNNLFVNFGETWEYTSDWERGANLYPFVEDNSTYFNLGSLKKNGFKEISVEKYFKKVFKNLVEIDPEKILIN